MGMVNHHHSTHQRLVGNIDLRMFFSVCADRPMPVNLGVCPRKTKRLAWKNLESPLPKPGRPHFSGSNQPFVFGVGV